MTNRNRKPLSLIPATAGIHLRNFLKRTDSGNDGFKKTFVERRDDKALQGGFDRVVVRDPAAPPIWARFYEIGTNRPIFSGRDGVVRFDMALIELERRVNYAWYGYWPADLLAHDYEAWRRAR